MMSDVPMTERFLYLTTNGRTSGLPHTIEIWFVEHRGRHYIVSERGEASGWVQNLRKDARVRFSVGTREAREDLVAETPAQAGVVTADDELLRAVRAAMDAKYAWSDGLVVELAPDR